MVYLDQMPTRTFDAIVPYGVKYVLQRNPLQGLHMSNEYRYTCNIGVPTQNLNVSFCSCLCPIHWSQVLSQDWRCNWSSADRRCSSYVWMMNNVIAYQVAFCIRGLTIWQERLNVVTKLKNVKLNIYIYIYCISQESFPRCCVLWLCVKKSEDPCDVFTNLIRCCIYGTKVISKW